MTALSHGPRSFCVTMDIDNGILSRARRPRELDDIFIDRETRRSMTGEEVLQMGRDLKAKGFKLVPVCDHHDEKGSCLGHPASDDNS